MKKHFRELFTKVNEFDNEYYDALITAYKFMEDSVERYYDEVSKYLEEEGSSSQKKAEIWNLKVELVKEKELMLNQLREKEDIIQEKAQQKLFLPEDEFKNMYEGVKKVEDHIKQL